ncbi:MAG TPA: histidine--tRNA ligase [Bacilli bacterium]|nr:histidine--tRNA ligase [Bacilli bacterium]
MAISIPKGTHDIIANEARGYDLIEEVCANIATLYGFDPLRTPIFESTDLFSRGVGESSDIVSKEMYTFLDKGDRSITLRPEGTAGIVRSLISNKLHAQADLPLKYYYDGPMFRYERPQLGRFRQFHQFGVESLGVTSIHEDIEVIFLGYEILRNLGFEDITLKINSLGDGFSRENYKSALQTYYKDKVVHMCDDCKQRYKTNPLRILDCKVPADQELTKDAPKMNEFLSEKAKADFDVVLEKLEGFDISYVIDEHLVRGLDYYSGIIFEFSFITSEGKDYGALGGGGHYDRLVKELGGPNLEGVGFAFGIERLYAVMRDEGLMQDTLVTDDVHIMSIGEAARGDAIDLGETLRTMGIRVILNYEDKPLKSLFKRAERNHAKFAVIIGEEEVKTEILQVKNMETEEQVGVAYDQAVEYIVNVFKQAHHDHQGCGCEHDHEEGECNCEEHEHESCDCGHNHEHDHKNGECKCDDHKHEHDDKECKCKEHAEKDEDCKCKDGEHQCKCEEHNHDENDKEYCACGHSELVNGQCECGHHEDHEDKECGCNSGQSSCGCHDHKGE